MSLAEIKQRQVDVRALLLRVAAGAATVLRRVISGQDGEATRRRVLSHGAIAFLLMRWDGDAGDGHISIEAVKYV